VMAMGTGLESKAAANLVSEARSAWDALAESFRRPGAAVMRLGFRSRPTLSTGASSRTGQFRPCGTLFFSKPRQSSS
jgi:hypothetical protein